MTPALDLKLSNDRHLEEFLRVTVETTRKTLKCARVIVDSAGELPRALVLAESVDALYPSILGRTIKDPFLEGEHLEMYRHGLPAVINDIDTADVGQSDLEDLEKLGIKSLAIAPIAVENKLLALLVAHQSSNPQPWPSETIYFLLEKANAIGLALSNIANPEKQQDSHVNNSEEKKSGEAEGLPSLQANETVVKSSRGDPRQREPINSGNSPLSSEVASEVDTPLRRLTNPRRLRSRQMGHPRTRILFESQPLVLMTEIAKFLSPIRQQRLKKNKIRQQWNKKKQPTVK